MTYAFVQDVPIGRDLYAQIRDGLGSSAPPGMIAHLVIEKPDGLLRYIDVWESEDAWESFVDRQMHPVVGAVFAKAGFVPAGEPPRERVEVIDAWLPGGAARG